MQNWKNKRNAFPLNSWNIWFGTYGSLTHYCRTEYIVLYLSGSVIEIKESLFRDRNILTYLLSVVMKDNDWMLIYLCHSVSLIINYKVFLDAALIYSVLCLCSLFLSKTPQKIRVERDRVTLEILPKKTISTVTMNGKKSRLKWVISQRNNFGRNGVDWKKTIIHKQNDLTNLHMTNLIKINFYSFICFLR